MVNWAFNGSKLGITMKYAPHTRPGVDSKHWILTILLGKDAFVFSSVGTRAGYVCWERSPYLWTYNTNEKKYIQSKSWVWKYLFQALFLILWGIYSEVGLLDQMIILFFNFLSAVILFSTMAVTFYIPTNMCKLLISLTLVIFCI